jgi:predicted permease
MLNKLRLRLRALFFKSKMEEELDDEVRFHLEREIQENIARGMRPEEARVAALRSFGGVERVKEESRDERGIRFLEEIWQDLRYGGRMLWKNPGFTLVAVITLALGIGANTALFSLVDAVLLKMLPVRKPEELVLFKWTMGPRWAARMTSGDVKSDAATGLTVGDPFSYPAFEQFRAESRTLSDVFAFVSSSQLNLKIDGQAEAVAGQFVTGGFYAGLGVQPALGRMITNDDDRASANPVAVISYRYWQRRFGLDATVVGKTINVNSVPFTIIGVTPRQFYGGLQLDDSPNLSLPLLMEPRVARGQSELHDASLWNLRVMGRLKPGAHSEAVRAELESAFQQNALAGWNSFRNSSPLDRRPPDHAQPPDLPRLQITSGAQGLASLREAYRQPLKIMLFVVALTLLVACANVANLLLARAESRRQEVAVRLALGAGRFRLIRQLLTESLLLAGLGGALGWALAWWSKGLLLMWRPGGGGRLNTDLPLDWRVFGFTAAVVLGASLLFGLAPALRATRVDLNSALKENARGASGSLSRLGKSLVIAQVAVSLVLLVWAGLFVRTLRNLQSVELGFNAENLLLFKVDPHTKGYKNEQIAPLYQQMIERIEAVPGVRSATISEITLLSRRLINGPAYAHRRAPLPQAERIVFQQNVRWNYFATMGMPLLAGRSLTPRDDERAPKVAVINQTMARRFFGDENPVGQRFGFNSNKSDEFEIVGVVGDTKYFEQRQENPSVAYLSYQQRSLRGTTFAVRTVSDPMGMIGAVREAVRQVDRDLPLFQIKTQREQADEALAQERFFPKLAGLFGLLALGLASIGLYGVMAHAVAQRTHEIAIRMALGATQASVLKRVIGQGMSLAAIGIALGAAVALALARSVSSASFELARFISDLLFGVRADDPATFVVIAALLIIVALLACYLPARRATKVDPMVALRYE